MAVTEIACMRVQAGLDVMNEDTTEGQVLHRTWQNVISLPDGPSRVYWGLEDEEPSKIWAFFDWESVEEHEVFATMYGADAVKDLPKVLASGEFTKHVSLTPFPPVALRSPVALIVLTYFASEISVEEKDRAGSRFKLFIEKGLQESPEVEAVSFGWGVETDFPVRGGDEGQRGALLTAIVGWSGSDAGLGFEETDGWKESVEGIEGLEGVVKMAVVHIRCESLESKIDRA
ncbi:uncharacterized protein K460DRAFT_332664 [Cucurbitaria berberidis CBS 394.84]|uniref:ABM domain-containing protein n=1 Tax=Cucurbitaria berberidis CBS 394.84 TaxID=1168544 RepID=A0A9P4GJR2_9PLEO|nr:uncharacterized protein K460DRAFT_332664 [Cucurbitaria berberidis CBS 394.84]KAF1847543.1 hypothetical protein K460DRAFT_332664 [Cucurbitaria berberidis CBS 394.84]